VKSNNIHTASAKRVARQHSRNPPALVILVWGCAGALLFFGHAVFVPIALAILFSLLLSAPVEALNRKGISRSVSAVVILVIFLALIAGTVNVLWTPGQEWLAAAPRTSQIIQRKIGPAARIMQRIETLSTRGGNLADGAANGSASNPKPTPAAPPSQKESEGLLAQTRAALIAAVTVVILTLFLLAAGPPVLARMTAAFAKNTQATHVLTIVEAIRGEVGRYYATIALINLGLGVATSLAMMALGMPNPVLWGVLAGVLNFVPYVGSATTFLVLTIVAFVSFDGLGHVLAVAGSYLALATLEGQVVQPLMVGQRLELNPIIVFLALWFAGWFWGVPGIVLAIPSLVALKVAAEHSANGAPLLEFLSPSKAKRFKPRERETKRLRTAAST
jgi:predicted PurR-regulated permease PerM